MGGIVFQTDRLTLREMTGEDLRDLAEMLLDPDTKIATLPVEVTGYFDLHTNTLATDFQNVLLGNETAQEYLDNWAEQMTQLKKTYDENVVNK